MDTRLEQALKELKTRLQNRQDELTRVKTLIRPTEEKARNLDTKFHAEEGRFNQAEKEVERTIASLTSELTEAEQKHRQIETEKEEKMKQARHDHEAFAQEVQRLKMEQENLEREIDEIAAEMRRTEAEIKRTLSDKE